MIPVIPGCRGQIGVKITLYETRMFSSKRENSSSVSGGILSRNSGSMMSLSIRAPPVPWGSYQTAHSRRRRHQRELRHAGWLVCPGCGCRRGCPPWHQAGNPHWSDQAHGVRQKPWIFLKDTVKKLHERYDLAVQGTEYILLGAGGFVPLHLSRYFEGGRTE
mgnify:CR=1 FL=1